VIEFNSTRDFNNDNSANKKRTNVALKVMRIYFGMDTRVCASYMLENFRSIFTDFWGYECTDDSTAREWVVEHGKHSNVAFARFGFTCQVPSHKSTHDFGLRANKTHWGD